MSTRFLLWLEYDGAPFCGWQRQHNGLSVQQVLEDAATQLEGRPVRIIGAGRTDAGVHAYAQAAHIDIDRPMSAEQLCRALNALTRPHPVSVWSARIVPANFHVRFDALARHYTYKISNRPARPALAQGRVWHLPFALDADSMAQAAQDLIGHHDFTTFRDSQCQAKTPLRTLDRCIVTRKGTDQIWIECTARSFLHRQVRSMVGSLIEVGRGRWPIHQMHQALRAADRSQCGPVAPACGLYLTRIDYPSMGGAAK